MNIKIPINFNYRLQNTSSGGFTLLELVVAVGIFTVVMVIAAGSLLSIIDANKKAHAERLVMDNLHFSLSSITRFIRTGTNYHCGSTGDLTVPQDCADNSVGDTFLSLQSSTGELIAYRLNGTQIERSMDNNPYVGITSSQITIDRFKFFVMGSASGDGEQPRVLILLSGFVGGGRREESRFNIQTTVSQRELDS